MLTIPGFVPELLFPGVARQTPPEALRTTRIGPTHMLPVAAGTVAFKRDVTTGDETCEPVAACRVQLFTRTSASGEHTDWLVTAEPIAADGKVMSYDRIVLADESSGYYGTITGNDPDELLRQARAGALFVNVSDEMQEIEEDALDREQDHG